MTVARPFGRLSVLARIAPDQVGRTRADRNGREIHYSSFQAEAWFRRDLAKALTMTTDAADRQEVRT